MRLPSRVRMTPSEDGPPLAQEDHAPGGVPLLRPDLELDTDLIAVGPEPDGDSLDAVHVPAFRTSFAVVRGSDGRKRKRRAGGDGGEQQHPLFELHRPLSLPARK